MSKFKSGFLLGAATAAHQVEGNNIHSDYWVQENLPHSQFAEPSGIAVDHYRKYKEDIDLMKNAGLNAYRFSIEWARIEPEEGKFDEKEMQHYLDVIDYCHKSGIEPVVTLFHFSSPAWLIRKGGWEDPMVVDCFRKYVAYVISYIKGKVHDVCTINEANMRIQLYALVKSIMARMQASAGKSGEGQEAPAEAKDADKNESKVQVGLNLQGDLQKSMMESAEAFGLKDPRKLSVFVSPGTPEGDILVMKAHQAAKEEIKKADPSIQVGLTLSLHDIQAVDGGEEKAQKEWEDEFLHYIPYIKEDDFLGVQNYTRKCIGPNGDVQPADQRPATQMGYEDYPEALGHVLRKVHESFPGDLIVTENGIATDDDGIRCDFIEKATDGVQEAIADGIPVKGYFYWSLLDNFEWQKGFSMTFGLIAVDRKNNCERHPKESLRLLGSLH